MKQLLNVIAYDIQFSFQKNRVKWVFAVIILLFLCARIFHEVSLHSGSYDFFSELWLVMSGAREYLLSEDSSFQLPAYWILFHGYLFFLIGFYPVSELHLGNGQAFIRAPSRKIWLISKLISIFLNIALYYGCFLALLLIGNAIFRGEIIPGNGIIGLSGIPIFNKSFMELITAFILLPLFVSVTLGEIQVVMSFFLNPVLSFMIVVAYMIASVFWMNPFLIGNFAMLYRQDWISGKPEISVIGGMLLCFVLTAATFIAGVIQFQKKDILPIE